jgi:hypothetical protein
MWSDAVILTPTLVRSVSEDRVLRGALTTLVAHTSCPIVLADGGSPPSFLEFCAQLPRVRVVPSKDKPSTLVSQIRNGLELIATSDARWVLYT